MKKMATHLDQADLADSFHNQIIIYILYQTVSDSASKFVFFQLFRSPCNPKIKSDRAMSTENQTIDSGVSENINAQDAPKKRKPGSPGMYQRLDMPTPESIAQEDFMNNCAVRTILSGVMGTGLGVVFGIFMGTMDTSVCADIFGLLWLGLAGGDFGVVTYAAY